ncbi:MAG TPA: hypothetical protein VIF57_13060 [Polyangia bacterium]|jgi:hypothetical protein
MVTVGLLAFALLAQEGAYPPPPASATPAAPGAEAPAPVSAPQPPPAPPPAAEPDPLLQPRRYGDRGSIEIGGGLGYSSLNGLVAAAAFRYFVVDGVAPGFEATYVSGGSGGLSYGLLLGALRVVPVRTRSFALLLTGRAGRMLLGDHPDGWAAGGGAGILILLAPTAGIELGYEVLRLLPSSFCADLSSCVIQGPVLGFRFGV